MGNNINIPYSGYIQGGLTVGTDVVISGRTHPDFKRFAISLCAGPTCDYDTALTFNPRFDDGRVVRNHKQSGSWGMEETNGGMPFRRGHNFEIQMKVEQRGYKIQVNSRHFCDFHHRIPKERAQYLYIEGDVTITFIQFRGQGGYPTGSIPPPAFPAGSVLPPPYPGGPGQTPAPVYPGYPLPTSGPLSYPSVPLVTPIHGGMYPGKIIFIAGIPNQNPGRFTVNLACGANESSDISLHFDVRFKFGDSCNVVVRTHKEGGRYGLEERHQNFFPFSPGANFELMILAEHNCFKAAVNGQHYTEFFLRILPLERANYLTITGDVRLIQVRFQ